MRKNIYFFIAVLCALAIQPAFSQTPPPAGQTTGGILQQEQQSEKARKLEKEIKTPPKKETQVKTESPLPEAEGEKVLVKKINVEGATLLSNSDIEKVTKQFEGQALSIKQMQKIADLISDEYRKKNLLTSRAYLPQQTIKEGVLIIKVVEGKVGNVSFQGNKWFKTSLLQKKIKIIPEQNFDYSSLQKSLTYINEHPDRKAKAVLVPGKLPGTTDIVIDVKDRLPVHVGMEYDNWGSRFIDNDRWSFIFEHNNLLGLDDKFYFQLQNAEYSSYKQEVFRYLLPLTRKTELGFYYAHNKIKLLEDFEAVDARGKANVYSLYLNQVLLDKESLDVRLTFGFDYKDIRNYLLGVEDSRDAMRVIKTLLDINLVDAWGRTIINPEIDAGIPRMMGGLASKDSLSSRGDLAGGRFVKGTLNLFRLQPGPLDTSFLWKNQLQYCKYNLVAAEQFQIGGATSVRGYAPAEYTGDEGYFTSLEWSIPFYFIPKNTTIPLAKGRKLYDALRLVTFYDYGSTHLKTPAVGEKKHQTLRGWGYGLRVNVNENLTARVEIGYPLGRTPSDGKHVHPWIEVTSKF